MEKQKTPRGVKIRTILVFLIVFMVINACAHLQVQHHKDEEQLKATYTAEATVRRVESQLNKYVAESDLLKKIIESGYEMNDKEFKSLSSFMRDDSDIIEAIELAKNGVVSKIYPLKSNEKAMGLDMLKDSERKESANLARTSGKYTIAGPFKLVQGGKGALLFDPIYTKGSNGKKQFWGFSILVINWDRFIDGLQLEQLDDAAYHYKIWKKDLATGKKITLAKCESPNLKNALNVACEVPNDTWYFDIEPKEGWYSKDQLIINTLLCIVLGFLAAVIYWQSAMRRYKEHIYAQEIEKSAVEARAANSAKTNFLSRMSHDIRTPLNGIIGLLKIDEKHPDDANLIRNNRRKMVVAANHLLSLINDVLQMSKLESGEITLSNEMMNLNDLSADILTIMEQRAAESGITLEYDKKSDNVKYPYVYGSPLHLRQIFLNIYGNCVKYNKVGGKVYTHFSYMGRQGRKVTYQWTISDTGIGMSQEFLQHIFEPFAQEHSDARSIYHGTGIGMAIVKSLIDQMDGTIQVTSEEGKGSTFIISIPFEIAQIEQQEENEKQEDPENRTIQGMKFLLAEDNELNAEIAKILLEDEGAKITVVNDGKQAVQQFEQNKPGTYDAVLMDVMMPVMDGILATQTIRKMDREDAGQIPIIAMTANAYEEDAKKCLQAGMNAHLSKPLQMEHVLETITKFVKK